MFLNAFNVNRLAHAFVSDIRQGNSDMIDPWVVIDPNNEGDLTLITDYMTDTLNYGLMGDLNAFKHVPEAFIRRVKKDDDLFNAVHSRVVTFLSPNP